MASNRFIRAGAVRGAKPGFAAGAKNASKEAYKKCGPVFV
jgi:hypothetical protein